MKKFFEALVKPSKLILAICAIVYAAVFMIATFGDIDEGFLPIMSTLIILIVTVAATGGLAALLFLNKEKEARMLFITLAIYYLLAFTQDYLSDVAKFDGMPGLVVARMVFSFFVGLALTAVIVLMVLHIALHKEMLGAIAVLVFICAFGLLFIRGILLFAEAIKYEYEWPIYFRIIADLAAPAGVFFGYLYFFGKPQCGCCKKEKEERYPQPVQEQEEDEGSTPIPVEE